MIYRCNERCCVPERCCPNRFTPSPTTIVPLPPATNFSAFASNTQQTTLNLEVGGTNIPLPNHQYIPTGFFMNDDNTQLIVVNAGVYSIQYGIHLTTPLLVGSRVMQDNVPIAPSILGPALDDDFSTQFIVTLPANTTLSLQLFGLNGVAVLRAGVGAFLSVIRLQ